MFNTHFLFVFGGTGVTFVRGVGSKNSEEASDSGDSILEMSCGITSESRGLFLVPDLVIIGLEVRYSLRRSGSTATAFFSLDAIEFFSSKSVETNQSKTFDLFLSLLILCSAISDLVI